MEKYNIQRLANYDLIFEDKKTTERWFDQNSWDDGEILEVKDKAEKLLKDISVTSEEYNEY